VLRLPLAEAWHRTFDKTAFEATPVIADEARSTSAISMAASMRSRWPGRIDPLDILD